jgi:hypothetical protein
MWRNATLLSGGTLHLGLTRGLSPNKNRRNVFFTLTPTPARSPEPDTSLCVFGYLTMREASRNGVSRHDWYQSASLTGENLSSLCSKQRLPPSGQYINNVALRSMRLRWGFYALLCSGTVADLSSFLRTW